MLRLTQEKSLKAVLVAGCATIALLGSPMVSDVATAQQGGKQLHGNQDAGGGARRQSGRDRPDREKGLGGIFRDITGVPSDDAHSVSEPLSDDGDEDSDRPEWAGQPGGKDDVGGGRPATSGSKKGDLFGDLWIIARDDQGVPILTPEGWVQPIAADGTLIPLDEEGHPVDETLTQEVELGRLNVGRAPSQVLDRRAEEVIALLNDATVITTDVAGRLVLTVDGTEKTIDSPLENLAIYVALMTEGTIPGVNDLPGSEYDFMVDGVYDQRDIAASVSFLAAATDKTGVFTPDEIAYIDTFLGINTTTVGSVTYSEVDYSDFAYDRATTYGDRTTTVLVEQSDGSFVPTEVNIYEAVFASTDASGTGTLDAYTLAADDARTVVNFIHAFEVPLLEASH